MLCVDTIFKMAAAVGLLLLQIDLFGQNKRCSMGENAFHMVFQERWVFSHSSPNPALAATRLWAGYGELVGENSISPGKPCEMHIMSLTPREHCCQGRRPRATMIPRPTSDYCA